MHGGRHESAAEGFLVSSTAVSRPARGARSRTDPLGVARTGEGVYLALFALSVATLWVYAWGEAMSSPASVSSPPIVWVQPAAPRPDAADGGAGRP